MIEPIKWPRPHSNELPNPFLRGKLERTLKLTFHTSSFTHLSETEADALDVLVTLGDVPDIQTLHTDLGEFPRLEIGAFDGNSTHLPLSIVTENGSEHHAGVPLPRQWLEIAAQVTQKGTDNDETKATFNDFIVARAHCALERYSRHNISQVIRESHHAFHSSSKSSYTDRGSKNHWFVPS